MTEAVTIDRRRRYRDRLATALINIAGFAVIAVLGLMLWYLISVALPLAESLRVSGPSLLDPGGSAEIANSSSDAVAAESAVPMPEGEVWALDDRSTRRWLIETSGVYRCDAMLDAARLPGASPPLAAATLAEGRETLVVVDSLGRLQRYSLGADEGCRLTPLGEPLQQPFVPRVLLSEERRPLLYLIAGDARMRVLQSISGELLYQGSLPDALGVSDWQLSPADAFLTGRRGDQWFRWDVSGRYAEADWRSLWLPQQYSGYPAPAQIWHPGGEGVGSLSKYGISPLLFGTFKAALYGMCLAVPLALGAAVYTGYFLSRRQRNRVKPAIEMLEAIPTVVLGFLAGLWLAPLLSDHLLLVFLVPPLLITVPLLLAASHLLLQQLSDRFVRRPPRVATLAAAYLVALLLLWLAAAPIERLLFAGSLEDWLLNVAGVNYQQRNALLVGLAMGIALLPTLFSIVEDAIFAVPRGLSDGSLALGATRWQSLSRVVLPAASPAILSALLIGLARGLGETMIVLLATGNTPLMDPSLFTGLRSVSASLAAELPEASVGGTQFRVLFFAALVLFALTFFLNTIAELFRQRLRYRYAGR